MRFSELAIGDLFNFLEHYEQTYKKVGEKTGIPMCSRMNHVADINPETEVVLLNPSAYSRDREENSPDFEQLAWELECQIREMNKNS